MAQSYNLFDGYIHVFANALNGLLANPAFGADRMTKGSLVQQAHDLAVAGISKATEVIGDMSTALPPATTFTSAGVDPAGKAYTPPPDAPPSKVYVPPTTVKNPDGTGIPLKG